MTRVAAILVLAFLCSFAWAQAGDELIELVTEEISESAWQEFLADLSGFDHPIRLDSRFRLTGSATSFYDSALLKAHAVEVLVNLKRDLDSGNTFGNINALYETAKLEGMLGAWRLRFGRGLILGTNNRSAPDSLFSLHKTGSAILSTPLGAAVKLNLGNWRGAAFGSAQQREARLEDGRVASLPKSREGRFNRVSEGLFGLAFGYQDKLGQIGLLGYRQRYGLPFVDESLHQELWAGSLYASLGKGSHRLDGELAWQRGEPLGIIAWQYRAKSFRQTLSYARNGIKGQLPYALQPAVLSKDTGRNEYSYDFRLPLPWHASFSLRYSLNHGRSFDAEPLSRLAVALDYSHQGHRVGLSCLAFDRQVIALADSGYVSDSPQNYRLRLDARVQIRPGLFQKLELSYHLQDRADYRQNNIRASVSWGYEKAAASLRAGLVTRQSPRSFYDLDEFDPDQYSVWEDDDTALFGSAAYEGKRWRASGSFRRSVTRDKGVQLTLQVGLSLF